MLSLVVMFKLSSTTNFADYQWQMKKNICQMCHIYIIYINKKYKYKYIHMYIWKSKRHIHKYSAYVYNTIWHKSYPSQHGLHHHGGSFGNDAFHDAADQGDGPGWIVWMVNRFKETQPRITHYIADRLIYIYIDMDTIWKYIPYSHYIPYIDTI